MRPGPVTDRIGEFSAYWTGLLRDQAAARDRFWRATGTTTRTSSCTRSSRTCIHAHMAYPPSRRRRRPGGHPAGDPAAPGGRPGRLSGGGRRLQIAVRTLRRAAGRSELGQDRLAVFAEERRRRPDRRRASRRSRAGSRPGGGRRARGARPRRTSRGPWPRARRTPRATSGIGPDGTSAASSAASQSADGAVASRSAMIGRSAARCSTRSPFVANRGSAARSGKPMAAQQRGHCRSEPDRHGELAVGRGERLVRDDVRVGVAAPDRGAAR